MGSQDQNGKKVTPFMEQYLNVKKDHHDKLVLFRMGDFYEVFYEDAHLASKVLGITLTARGSKSGDGTPMAGIPHHALNDYLPRLINYGCRVAICDQVEDPATAKGIVKREVVRIVTKGTLTEDNLLDPSKNNFVMAVSLYGDMIYLAWLDLSTGEVFIRQVEKNRAIDAINSIHPSELLVSPSFEKTSVAIQMKATTELNTVCMDEWHFGIKSGVEKLKKVYSIESIQGFGLTEEYPGLKSIGALLEYITQTQLTEKLHLRKVKTVNSDAFMIIDRQTSKNLELFQNQQDGSTKGSLYECLNDTVTPMGARRLGMWMTQPLLDKDELSTRLEKVNAFYSLKSLSIFREALGMVKDIERPLGRIRCGRFSARDMKSIAVSLAQVPSLNKILETNTVLNEDKMNDEANFAAEVNRILKDELPLSINDGDMINDGYNEELDSWRSIRSGGQQYLHDLQERLKEELELPGLKVRHNKVFGYYIEVPKAQSSRVPAEFIRKQTLVNAERYIIEELKVFEDKIFNAQDKILEIENGIIAELRIKFIEKNDPVLQVANQLSQLDVISTFATLALKQNYVKPQISDEITLELEKGRHPIAEKLMGSGEFTPNDVSLRRDKTRMMLITGPNMSGKSTFIRQCGLVQIMFQIGCFVPATKATISLADRVFTRVGAGDDLSSGRSTFMVEMNETANILHNATPRSLVILDEVGRGTSTLDGLSLAWSISEELHNQEKLSPLCLFATHYHEMTELESRCEHMRNFQIKVQENEKNIVFLHQIVEGGADKSYGIHVAKLAGLPQRVISRANELLKVFEGKEVSDFSTLPEPQAEENGDFLFQIPEKENQNKLSNMLQDIEPDEITPLQALVFLKELKECAEE
jgi:DNA mismatch repair protein MutS